MSFFSTPVYSSVRTIGAYNLYDYATQKQQDFEWETFWMGREESDCCLHVKERLGGFKERCKFLDRLTEKLPQSCPPVTVNTPMDLDGPNTFEESLETQCQVGEPGSLPVPAPQDVVGPCTVNQLWRSAYERVRMPQLENVRVSRWVREHHEKVWKWRRGAELRARQERKVEVWQSGSGAFGAVGRNMWGY